MVSQDGEIHVTHKNAHPFNNWKVVKLAEELAKLVLVEKVPFYLFEYPGYINKRGSGHRCDQSFPVGDCSTFKFSKACDVESLILETCSIWRRKLMSFFFHPRGNGVANSYQTSAIMILFCCQNLGCIWFVCFLFPFWLKIEKEWNIFGNMFFIESLSHINIFELLLLVTFEL